MVFCVRKKNRKKAKLKSKDICCDKLPLHWFDKLLTCCSILASIPRNKKWFGWASSSISRLTFTLLIYILQLKFQFYLETVIHLDSYANCLLLLYIYIFNCEYWPKYVICVLSEWVSVCECMAFSVCRVESYSVGLLKINLSNSFGECVLMWKMHIVVNLAE